MILKKLPLKFFTFLLLYLYAISVVPAKAQLFESGQILRAGAEDANLLLKGYLKPFGSGFGADLNSGWFTSAKPLEKFGFDLRVTGSISFVPPKDRVFDVSQLGLKTVQVLDGPDKTPTAFGDDTDHTSRLGTTYFNSDTRQQEELFSFQMPEGSGYHFVPAPMVQFSLGLPAHSQVTLRYTPTITIDSEYKFNVFGLGGMVGLNPLLFNNTLPFDLSWQAGIMNLNADAEFDVRPKEDDDVENPYPDTHWDGQSIDFHSKTFAMNLLAGKEFSALSLFTGIGYQYATTSIRTIGSYPIVVPNDAPDSEGDPTQEIQSLDDPINLTLDGVNNVHLVGGFQLKIAFISFSTAFTVAKYPTFRAGIGIMFES